MQDHPFVSSRHCADCRKTYQRRYMRIRRSERPDIVEAERLRANRIYWSDPEAGRKRSKAWAAANPDKRRALNARRDPIKMAINRRLYYEAHAEQLREYARKRRKTHPEEKRLSQRKRRVRLRGSEISLTTKDVEAILVKGCLFCGTHENPTLAHDIPVSKGGPTNIQNCFCLCASCNSRMHTKTLREMGWLGATV